MDYEIEIKLPCASVEQLTHTHLSIERTRARHFEDNWVYKLPDGKLRKGQYLRVRFVGNGDGAGRRHAGMLTYKGKSRRTSEDSKGRNRGKKVREEVETLIGQPAKTVKILKRLGFTRSFRYQKYRTSFAVTLPDDRVVLATFDETPIGNFIELEGDASAIETVATELGYPPSAFISESYVELQFARCAAKGEPLSDMVFPKNMRPKSTESRRGRSERTKSKGRAGKGARPVAGEPVPAPAAAPRHRAVVAASRPISMRRGTGNSPLSSTPSIAEPAPERVRERPENTAAGN